MKCCFILLTIMISIAANALEWTDSQTYPCVEYQFKSTCREWPYRTPPPEKSHHEVRIQCDLKADGFTSTASQYREKIVRGDRESYGFPWDMDRRILSSPDAPRILFGTETSSSRSDRDSQSVTISFGLSQRFIERGEVTFMEVDPLLGDEMTQLEKQSVTRKLGDFYSGFQKEVEVGVIEEDNVVRRVRAQLTCSGRK